MSRYRSMTDAELLELQAAAGERHALPSQERKEYSTPDAAQASVAGALYWTIRVYWQDRPFVLVGGVGLVVWQLGRLFLAALRM